MIDEETLARINGKYVCPPDAGPAWRTAMDYGFDMSLIESTLEMTPEERLENHQQALNTALEVRAANKLNDAG